MRSIPADSCCDRSSDLLPKRFSGHTWNRRIPISDPGPVWERGEIPPTAYMRAAFMLQNPFNPDIDVEFITQGRFPLDCDEPESVPGHGENSLAFIQCKMQTAPAQIQDRSFEGNFCFSVKYKNALDVIFDGKKALRCFLLSTFSYAIPPPSRNLHANYSTNHALPGRQWT